MTDKRQGPSPGVRLIEVSVKGGVNRFAVRRIPL